MVLQELCPCYENDTFPEAEAPPEHVCNICSVDEKESRLFSPMLQHSLKSEAGAHLYNEPLITHVICIILQILFLM